jgi:uncharacterized membrane protein
MWMNGRYGLLMKASMGPFTVLVIAAVVVLVVWLAHTTTSSPNRTDPAEAETLLRRRYAAGDVTGTPRTGAKRDCAEPMIFAVLHRQPQSIA